jgi:hypothetical protein
MRREFQNFKDVFDRNRLALLIVKENRPEMGRFLFFAPLCLAKNQVFRYNVSVL